MRPCGLAFLLSALALLLRPAAAVRSEGSSGGSSTRALVSEHTVNILVTRHALSWANIAHDWIGSTLHIRMRDPLLTQVGMLKSREISEEVKKWLKAPGRNWTLDFVMSSTLVRAIETALLQYPGHKVSVVPFIAETGYGQDNVPRGVQEQTVKLQEHLSDRYYNEAFNVDFHWSEALSGKEDQSWGKFLNFLEDFFLPQFLAERKAAGVPDDVPINLAVVTHSNFMNSRGDILSRCGKLYPWITPKKQKPNNNQVLSLGYKLQGHAQAAWDVTTRYQMTAHGDCELVHEGVSNMDEDGNKHKLCVSDLGQDCVGYIKKKTGYWASTLDGQLREDYERILEKIEKYGSLRPKKKSRPRQSQMSMAQEIAGLTTQLRLDKKTKCWGGGYPTDPEVDSGKVEEHFPFTRKWGENGTEEQ